MRDIEPEILAEVHPRSGARGRIVLYAAGTALSLAVVSALATAPGYRDSPLEIRRIAERLEASPQVLGETADTPFVRIERILSGDTLGSILGRLGVDDPSIVRHISASKGGRQAIRGLRAGRAVTAGISADGQLLSLEIPISDSETYALSRVGDEFVETGDAAAATASIVKLASGTITSSLFAAADRAGLPDAATMKLAELFGTDIDFHTDLRKGDQFSVVYEMETRDGLEAGVGRILAAEFINDGKRYRVVHFEDREGIAGFYTPEGNNLKQAFLRSPLEFSRVTSGFAMRFHPIKKAWRQHKGVDFGAASGTAIKATSNGHVAFIGTQRGYGNTVELRHRNGITTLYAHMSRFPAGLRKGAKVSQGDVIGYVGSTGWATGPHLHYEFRKNDQPVNPMTVALPKAEPLEASELARFRGIAGQRLEQLALLNRTAVLAAASATD